MSDNTTSQAHLKHILRCSVETLKKFLSDLEIERQSTESSETQIEASGTVTHIGVTGYISGSIQYEMEPETAKTIAGGMYQRPIDELNEDAKAALREFVNISVGNAVTGIQQQYEGKEIDITPPSLLVGENIQLSSDVSASPVRIPLRTNYGDIVIDVALEKD